MEYLMEKMSSSYLHPMNLYLLKAITEDFSEKMKIGSGGYGEVYKGELNGDAIAVKKLFPVRGVNDEAFENEFRNLIKVQHKNVLRMIGYCYQITHRDVEYEGKLIWSQVIERALCFEYMKGGSLAKHISAESCIHDWPTTYKIINGTCEGLYHLHKGGEMKIFHLHLKPDNVLLQDEELVPKIGDFGLSKLFGTSYTHQISIMKGTIGFMPQEYIHNRKVSPKSDVFSLGVIIFHMMAGANGYGDYCHACRHPNFSPKIQQEFIERAEPVELIIPSKSSITSRPSSGHAEASSSTHSNNYLSAPKPIAMTFQELQRMTDGFSEKQLLGKGGFGMVYKGVDNGKAIAMKKLYSQPGLDDEKFRNELLNLMRVQHQNIIRLVGYCSETQHRVVEYEGTLVIAEVQERALCLEYMQGGSLDKHLSDESCGLDWETRYKIIEGIRQGLKHLHTSFKDHPIYHLDLKPANILLDQDLITKIGDFGLSRLLGSMETCVTKTFLGSRGYMPPEYIEGQQISPKFDVYSLGVIILQVIAGRDNYYKFAYMPSQTFIELVTANWSKRVQAETMSTEALLKVQKCIKIALRCVEANRENRPTITDIVEEMNMIVLATLLSLPWAGRWAARIGPGRLGTGRSQLLQRHGNRDTSSSALTWTASASTASVSSSFSVPLPHWSRTLRIHTL